ncbi:hypothetical protein GBAR_LOCUS28063 [Geodia barretti]|nr:hypothetical protein GBAR_LOCUS28063 [Geodia barretti]
MKLPSSKTDICVEQAKELCRREAVGCRGLSIEVVSATLVYIAWKNENSCVSAWDMVNTGVKPNVLLKATSKLCDQHPDLVSVSQEEPLTDEQRLGLRLDRFSPPVHGGERRRVIDMAQQIWSMVLDVKVQDLHLRKIPINDYCILAVALQYVRRKDLPKSEVADLSKSISMTVKTVNTRIWLIKKALVTLAARCPCLEEDVKNRVIRTQNVQRYLDRLLQNKHYLSCEMELIREGEVNGEEITGAEKGEGESGTKRRRPRKRARKSAVSSLLPVVFANSVVGEIGGGGGGEDENLSDLDDEIDEYILTEEQVKMRKYLLSINSDNEEHSPTQQDSD